VKFSVFIFGKISTYTMLNSAILYLNLPKVSDFYLETCNFVLEKITKTCIDIPCTCGYLQVWVAFPLFPETGPVSGTHK
jgi:hypothetical protein